MSPEPCNPRIILIQTGREDGWERWQTKGTLTFADSLKAITKTLSRDFVDKTLLALDPTYNGRAQTVSVGLIQQGYKCAIYSAECEGYGEFILVASRGTPQLDREVKADYQNLGQLRQALITVGLPVFVPQPLILDQKGVPAFSIERLSKQFELTVKPSTETLAGGELYTDFYLNDTHPRSVAFKERLDHLLQKDPDEYIRINDKIKEEIIARLAIVHDLTGCVPREFMVNAGDFMADPDQSDFNLNLITIRGGWQQIPTTGKFREWLMSHKEEMRCVRLDNPNITKLLVFDLFEDEYIIAMGLMRARSLLLLRRPERS